jgi:hypothetical protein
MARATVSGGRGGRRPKPTLNSKLTKFARSVPGIVGASIIEGVGGPKAKVATRAAGTIIGRSRGLIGKTVPKKGRNYAADRERAREIASERLATRNKTQKTRAGDKVKINPAALGSSVKSGKPTPNRGGGLRTTTGRPKTKVTKGDVFEAVRSMRKSPSGSSTTTGTGAVRGTAPKPGVRITTRTSGGTERRILGPEQKVNVKIKKRTEGPSRRVPEKRTVTQGRIVRDIKVERYEKPPIQEKNVSVTRVPSYPKEKVTVQKPLKKTNPKEKGSAITVRQGTPRKPSDVRERMQRERRDRLRESLTPRLNPARPKTTPQRGAGGSGNSRERNQEIIDRYYRIRFRDQGAPTARSAQGKQGSIESRVASGSEKPTRGRSNSSDYDKEAENLLNRSLRALEDPKVSAKEKIKPGKRTNVAKAVKSRNRGKIIRANKNMRKVLREREIKEAAERMRKAEEAAKKAKRAK